MANNVEECYGSLLEGNEEVVYTKESVKSKRPRKSCFASRYWMLSLHTLFAMKLVLDVLQDFRFCICRFEEK